MKMKSLLWLLLPAWLSGLSLLCGCSPPTAAKPSVKPMETTLEVKTTRPFSGEITRTVTLPGDIKAYQQATLYAKVTGYLKTLNVDKGDQVKEGALLAEIEVPELLADSAKSRAEVELAEVDYKRVSEAGKKAPDLVVPLSVDTAKSRYEVAKANLERANTLLAFTKIVAPFSGTVTRRMVDPGAFIPAATAGSPQNAALLTLAAFNTVRVQVAVPELESPRIAQNQPVQVTVDSFPGRAFEGKITRFAYALDETSKTMLAEIELPNPDLALRPGMYAIAKIGIERKTDALLLPIEAVGMEKAKAFVFTVRDGKARKTPIRIGFSDGAKVEIASGIKADDAVILLGKGQLADGQAIVEAK
jgi:RND family efflux transporter MFP subunit